MKKLYLAGKSFFLYCLFFLAISSFSLVQSGSSFEEHSAPKKRVPYLVKKVAYQTATTPEKTPTPALNTMIPLDKAWDASAQRKAGILQVSNSLSTH